MSNQYFSDVWMTMKPRGFRMKHTAEYVEGMSMVKCSPRRSYKWDTTGPWLKETALNWFILATLASNMPTISTRLHHHYIRVPHLAILHVDLGCCRTPPGNDGKYKQEGFHSHCHKALHKVGRSWSLCVEIKAEIVCKFIKKNIIVRFRVPKAIIRL